MSKFDSSYDFPRPAVAGTVRRRNDGNWSPNTDAWTTADGLVIKIEVAGLRREDLKLTIDGNTIHITGERADGCRAGATCNFLLMEINYGAFESVIELPEGFDLSQARASYQNGFLRIDVPKAAGSRHGQRDGLGSNGA